MDVVPVVRGEFQYRDVLLVDCGGELKRHGRASEAEIKRLLNGKDGKDQVGHWWEAQLIHYGLPRSKQKQTAKVRLQQALSEGKLKAPPPHLVDMEAQMKKEYAAAVRRRAKGPSGSSANVSAGSKRAREEDSEQSAKKTKVTVKVGSVSVAIEESTSKKQKIVKSAIEQTSSAKKAKTSTSKVKSQVSTPISTGSAQWTGDPREHPDNVFQRSSSKRAVESPGVQSKAKKPKKKTIKTETDIKKANIKDGPEIQSEDDDMDLRADISQDQLNITGVYNLSCPKLAEQTPDYADKLRLFMCVDNEAGKIWGGFELAWKSGHIKIDNIAYNMRLTLDWRAKDYERHGSLKFGKGCFGDIEFHGREQVRGTLFNLFPEPLDFEGFRQPGPLWCGKSAYKFQQEWDEYPTEAYGG